MDNNIFNVDNWASSTFYYKNKVLTNNNLYYYAARDYTSSSDINTDINTDINNGNLNGYIYDLGIQKPYFQWKPSFDYNNKNTPRVKKIQFSDSYFQTLPDGINNLMLNFNFVFDTRDLAETTAILHFLSIRNGVESFVFLPPAPYTKALRFIVSDWSHSQKFYNNYTINANFVQTPV